ncbi:MAG TPA: Rab family GTPase [Candidatus Thiothrix moscowensis]|uniref:Rab family GTPase n=1 Tax=unclassified Thiothrix TaxID=2636184 RepID=UPI0025CF1EED|nr:MULTISPECIES: Rab family GTPase [unclassified Thiothrix]HRJ51430.1 Rab family GTPase [Candidatus Thiothrix moscowensis]HRJ91515.1 Rab family GTPase [Candidatus Thiothrix moscowensis]
MIQKKICLLGAFSVGKTSLIRRYVDSLFTDKYLTTVGVKIDKKTLQVDGQDITLMIWDIAGEDDLTNIRTAYLRGMSGYILVVDGTRPHTCDTALSIHRMVRETVGDLPALFALNKADLKTQWQLDANQLKQLQQSGCPLLETSAKQDAGVEDMFHQLVRHMGV